MATSARFGFPIEYTKDIPATRRFFTDVLGLELDRDHPTFVQFKDAGGAAYAIASDAPTPHSPPMPMPNKARSTRNDV